MDCQKSNSGNLYGSSRDPISTSPGARSGYSQNMLNHGAIHSKYGWKMGKYGFLTADQYSTIARLFHPTYSNARKEKCHPSKKTGATSKNEIRICSHLGLDQNLKKSIFVASTQADASMSPSEFPPVGGKLRAVAQTAHRFCSAPHCDKFILVG